MVLRTLEQSEHGKTRALWERVFQEDTKAFLDYYYRVKAADNTIYVVEEDGDIVSMLHLNPYEICIGEECVRCHYIVAVATEEAYRGRGYMSRLLAQAESDMKERGEPFTYLMPAAEAIYYPHGYRFVYKQPQGYLTGKDLEASYDIRLATNEDCASLAEFANRQLAAKYDVYARRDAHYYERLLEEYRSEQGGILIGRKAGTVCMCTAYAIGDSIDLVEPMCSKGEEASLQKAVYTLTKDEETAVKCYGYGTEQKPMIMAKVLDLQKMIQYIQHLKKHSDTVWEIPQLDGQDLGTMTVQLFSQLDVFLNEFV